MGKTTSKNHTAVEKTPAETWEQKKQRLASRRPRTQPVTLHDEELVNATLAAAEKLKQARIEAFSAARKEHPEASIEDLQVIAATAEIVKDATAATEQAADAATAAEVTFTFQRIPPEAYDEVQFLHPPTDAQSARGQSVNPHTLIPALMALCSVDPLTEEEAVEILRAGNANDSAVIYQTIQAVNEKSMISLGKGSAPTPN